MTVDVLSARALNRATLARQLLLDRADRAPLDAVRHLVGLQAQEPLNPYLALWSRLRGFRAEALAQLLLDREAVRIVTLRGTVHLVTADDCLILRPLVQPVLDAELRRHPEFGPALVGVDLRPPLEHARALLAERPRTQAELRRAFEERFPELDGRALAYACRNHLPLVQVPPRGVWGTRGGVRSTTAEAWLGRPVDPAPSIDDVVLRYFAAFGPAAVADVATWSRLTGLREVVERLGPRQRAFRDERGRTLHDLPDAPRPDPDVPAPVRFLPQYDDALLSHDDRRRFGAEGGRLRPAATAPPGLGTVLHDGVVRGTWRLEPDDAAGRGGLVVDVAGRLTRRAEDAIAAEGRRVLRFLATDGPRRADPDGEVRVVRRGS